MRSRTIKHSRSAYWICPLIAAAVVCSLAPSALAAESVSGLSVTRRTALAGGPNGDGYSVKLRLNINGTRLEGGGQLEYQFTSEGRGGPIVTRTETAVYAEGTLIGDEVKLQVTGPDSVTLVVTSAPPTDDPKNVVHVGSTLIWPMSTFKDFNVFAAALTDGRYEATTKQKMPGGTWDVLTTMELSAGTPPAGAIEVKAEHDVVPGHVGYFNKVSFRLPETKEVTDAIAKSNGGIEAVAEVATHGRGRLVKEIGEWGHARELRVAGVKPGNWYELYYSWNGAGPVPAHSERIRVSIPGLELEGQVGFDVGIDFEVVSVERIMNRPPEIGRPELLRIKVRDALHPQKSTAELAHALGLKPELSLKQTGYQFGTTLSDFITGFSINSSGVAEIMAAAMTGKGKATVMGNMLSWEVGPHDVLSGAGGDLAYPYARFQQRGLFFFEAGVSGLSYTPYEGGIMHDPPSAPKPMMIAVTELDPETEFLVNVLVPCIQGLIQAGTGEPVEGWKAVWECLDTALNSQLAQQALADHVLINALAIWIADMINSGVEVAEVSGQVLKPQTADEVQEQVIEQFQQVAGQLNDAVVAAVSKDGLSAHAAESNRDGTLVRGPGRADLNRLIVKSAVGERAPQAFPPQNRVQEGNRYLVVPASKGETLTLELAGHGKPGEAIVISKSHITRIAYPDAAWQSKLAIGPDGTVRVISGSPIQITSQPVRKSQAGKPAPGTAAEELPASGQAATDELWQRLKSKPAAAPEFGLRGTCEYFEIPGRAQIVRIGKTQDSVQQAKVIGGPGYEGLEVRYTFVPDAPIQDAAAKNWASRTHVLQLTNSWYPGPRFVEKYGLQTGVSIPAEMKVITKGACSPYIFQFPGIDLADDFESER